MDTPNNTVVIQLPAFAVLLIMHRQTVRIPGKPYQSTPSVPAVTRPITKDTPSIGIFNNEKIHNQLTIHLLMYALNILICKKQTQRKPSQYTLQGRLPLTP